MSVLKSSYKVGVAEDFLQKIGRAKPLVAIQELIWNALDADAKRVEVRTGTMLGDHGVEQIEVIDNGTGIEPQDVELFFTNIGGSWKAKASHTRRESRVLHGKEGKGRFLAHSLGAQIRWDTTYDDNGLHRSYSITTTSSNIRLFEVTKPIETKAATGTKVTISQIADPLGELTGDRVVDILTIAFAPYLVSYPQISLVYRGCPIDVKAAFKDHAVVALPPVMDLEGKEEIPEILIVEWSNQQGREFHLCDPSGLSLARWNKKLHLPGWDGFIYIKSRRIRQLYDRNELDLHELNNSLEDILGPAADALKAHYLKRRATDARGHIETLKSEGIYPYSGNPADKIEEAKRQIFDVMAVNIAEHLPRFDDADTQARKLSYSLLKQALEENPQSVQRILNEVIDLPKEKQDELAALLDQTSFSSIIHASTTVANRLRALEGFSTLLFDPDLKKHFKERSQLHRILMHELWMLQENYHLTVSDRGLTEVLRKHRATIGEDSLIDDDPVVCDNGNPGIVDLMLSQTIVQPNRTDHHHLVIELKRPSENVSDKHYRQTKKYARAIANDERFRDTNTRWDFWILSNDLTADMREEASQKDRLPGLLFEEGHGRYRIWAKTWGTIINEAKARMSFFQEGLELDVDSEAGLRHLKQLYADRVPEQVDTKLSKALESEVAVETNEFVDNTGETESQAEDHQQ